MTVLPSTPAASSIEPELRVRLDLGYDGTDFHGWAAQPGLRTVQGELEAALATVLRADRAAVSLTVGGRTDAGVHARGQVAHLDVTAEQLARWNGRGAGPGLEGAEAARLRARRLQGALRRSAPDIAIRSVTLAPPAFDARFSALERRYEYRIRDEAAPPDPLTSRFTVDVPRPLDLRRMRRASERLLGLNDFTSFCKAREGATAVRTLLEFSWRETEDGAFAARIAADAFCHSMVRALVGGVVAVGAGRLPEEELTEILHARVRTSRFTVMPAHGLSLEAIGYPDDDGLGARAAATRARRSELPWVLERGERDR
ncbi:tRNA pseudouridine(38-40) synthase TruA [Leucobacter tardus]|uniref:tRNA pseudouridine(38-40) synthase TruA n=1 Tax=Leucobacter tardus TaxID=501483 RepID=UPI0027DDF599|nr:tRNA pseudouridine(38-40) synthase TruA [Leucobacter tardus]